MSTNRSGESVLPFMDSSAILRDLKKSTKRLIQISSGNTELDNLSNNDNGLKN